MTAAATTPIGTTIAVVLLVVAVVALIAFGAWLQRWKDRRELQRQLDDSLEEWSRVSGPGEHRIAAAFNTLGRELDDSV